MVLVFIWVVGAVATIVLFGDLHLGQKLGISLVLAVSCLFLVLVVNHIRAIERQFSPELHVYKSLLAIDEPWLMEMLYLKTPFNPYVIRHTVEILEDTGNVIVTRFDEQSPECWLVSLNPSARKIAERLVAR